MTNTEHDSILPDVFFRQLFSLIPKPVLIFDEVTTEIIDANDTALRLYGYTREEIRRLTALDISIEPEKTRNAIQQTVAGEISEIPFRYHKKKDGTIFPVEVIPTAIPHEGRNVLCGVIKDISERVKLEEALRESERKYATLLSNLPGIAYRCHNDLTQSLDFISEGCFDLTGYPVDMFTKQGRTLSEFIHVEDRATVYQEIRDSVVEKRSYKIVYRLINAFSETKYVLDQGRGVYDKDGNLLFLEGFITNVTEQKNSEFELQKENFRLKSSVQKSSRFGDIIGQSPAMLDIYDAILKASMSDANVILYGESGTGKELAARAIHDLSDRKDKPFISVNCGAIPHDLIESEFFGHKKGAFTGAFADKMGYLDCADGGTLFLDEIGDISQNIQVKLLRAIDEGGFNPVGGKDVKHPDFRIISATNKDLRQLIKQGTFREDFFYRIHILSIHMPPLRKRLRDIPLLAHFFVQLFSHGEPCSIPSHVLKAMENYSWPGNVRELKNVIQRFVALKNQTPDRNLLPLLELSEDPDIPVHVAQPEQAQGQELYDIKEQVERDHIQQTLEKERWHKGNSARILGIHPKTLARKMKRYGLS